MVKRNQLDDLQDRRRIEVRRQPRKLGIGKLFIGQQRIDAGNHRRIGSFPMAVIGVAIDWSPLDPIKALFWSAVINGVVAVPIIAAMMVVISKHSAMGKFTASARLQFCGWAATAVMATAAVAMFALG